MSINFQEYRDRVHFKGDTTKEYVRTKAEESIQGLLDSQYGFNISIGDSSFEVAILSTKTTQEYEAANIIAPLSVGLDKGVVFKWDNNEWIVLKKMFRPDQPGFNGIAYKCTKYLKWIDPDTNQLYIQPSYMRSGRITNALGVTPDKNQVYDDIVMHDTDWNMMAATKLNSKFHPEMRFIVDGQAYRVTNVDNVSIDNVSIVSFVDDKLLDSDDVVNMIAHDDKYDYSFQYDSGNTISINSGENMDCPITVLSNGIPCNETYSMISSNNACVCIEDNKLVALSTGQATITCILDKNKYVTANLIVNVIENAQPLVEDTYIVGNDFIYWNSSQSYALSNGETGTFSVKTSSLIKKTVTFNKNSNNEITGVTIAIKDKYSGTLTINAIIGEKSITKTVYIKTT